MTEPEIEAIAEALKSDILNQIKKYDEGTQYEILHALYEALEIDLYPNADDEPDYSERDE